MSMEEIAGKLYDLYCHEVGGKAFNNEPLPTWADFRADPKKKRQSDAWVAVAAEADLIFSGPTGNPLIQP